MRIELILNVPIHPLDYVQSVCLVNEWIAKRKRPAAYVIQSNVSSLVNAQENELYKQTLDNTDLSVPDGMPLVWILQARGYSLKERVYGPDLMLMLCAEAAQKGWRCFLYGGMEGVPELLRDVLTSKFPGLKIVGTYSPPFRPLTKEEDEKICAMINATKPDIIWVGLGAPKQDIWMYEHREKLDVSVMHGVGAAFDFFTGRVRQAPRWMMNGGLEWLFRLMQEPRRLWRRYTLTNMKFAYYLVRSLIFKKGIGKLSHES